MRQRRRRTAVLALLICATLLVVTDVARDRPDAVKTSARQAPPAAAPAATVLRPTSPSPGVSPSASPTAPPTASTSPAPSASASASPSAFATPTAEPPSLLAGGPGTFRYAERVGPLLGRAGPLRRFQVAVEDGLGAGPDEFAADVDRILGDPRSWVASGRLRFQRVTRTRDAEFTVFLASPGTSARMCAAGGLDTRRYTSCRLPGQVIINVARWLTAVPGYGAPLDVYRAYAVNHEVGHQLGYGHEACPKPGAPAPVMQQQTLGLRGCVANAWPYLRGRRYAGAPIP